MAPRIALIHAGPVSVAPIEQALRALWPEAEPANLMDDTLMVDRAKQAELSQALSERILKLGEYARGLGADGVLYTCSAFGPAIEEAARRATWPVLKPNEAMFEEALQKGRRIGMVASFRNSIPQMEAEFQELASRRGIAATIRSACVPEALAALQRDDVPEHNRLLAEGATSLADSDVILLAQFSTARAAGAVRAAVSVPVLTAPEAAVTKMKRLLSR